MKNIIFKLLIIFVLVELTSCSQEINTESYYLKKDVSGKEILRFISKETNEIQTLKISSNETNNIIETKRLNSENQLIDKIKEKITAKGSELISYEIILKSSEVHSKIKFYPKQKDLLLWDLNKMSVYDGEFIFEDTFYKFQRKRVFVKKENQMLVFKDFYELKPIKEQFSKEIEWLSEVNFTQTTYYQKNKGLVKYERNNSNEAKVKFELIED